MASRLKWLLGHPAGWAIVAAAVRAEAAARDHLLHLLGLIDLKKKLLLGLKLLLIEGQPPLLQKAPPPSRHPIRRDR